MGRVDPGNPNESIAGIETERSVGRESPGPLTGDETIDGEWANLSDAPADSISISRIDVPTVPAHKRGDDGKLAEDLH